MLYASLMAKGWGLGYILNTRINPYKELVMSNVTMRDMLEAGVHFGHRKRYWNPQMAPYIFGDRSNIHIIDLEKTIVLFHEAMNFIGRIAAKKGKVLFVGTKRTAQSIIREQAERCHMPFVNHRWLGGMLTNYKTVRQSIKRLKTLSSMSDNQIFEHHTKKEKICLMRELAKLERSIGGIKNMGGLPDALFVVDVGLEKIAVREANCLNIPVIGIIDTNNSFDGVDYIIPGNDDSIRSISLYTSAAADVILDAKQAAQHGIVEDDFEEVGVEAKETVADAKEDLK